MDLDTGMNILGKPDAMGRCYIRDSGAYLQGPDWMGSLLEVMRTYWTTSGPKGQHWDGLLDAMLWIKTHGGPA